MGHHSLTPSTTQNPACPCCRELLERALPTRSTLRPGARAELYWCSTCKMALLPEAATGAIPVLCPTHPRGAGTAG
jgi:hypothetical protein